MVTIIFATLAKKRVRAALLLVLVSSLCFAATVSAAFVPDKSYLDDKAVLNTVQRDAFRFFWEACDPVSGMAVEANYAWSSPPIAVGGSGFGIAALVVAVEREWVSRDEAISRLLKITSFLRDKTQRKELHGAFPHWIDGATGDAVPFGDRDSGADIVETSFLMQGLLIARTYFNGPGLEAEVRAAITELWEDVDWNWFSNGEESGLYWHWDPENGFHHGLKIRGYNESLITYVLAASSPTHPISRQTYDYWTTGPDYQARIINEYVLEAAPSCGGPLFLTHYSFIGLNPHFLADNYVKRGYFMRGVTQTLANRAYCIYEAPEENRYSENFWGLTASQTKAGYAANSPCNDNGTVAPTAAISSMPFTPYYSLQVLNNFAGALKKRVWGQYGPYDGVSLRDDWVSDHYLAIDQLPIVCMTENYRSGLLWRLFMADKDVRCGLRAAGLHTPEHEEGFPEVLAPFKKEGGSMIRDAYEICRHPDSGQYEIPYFVKTPGVVSFVFTDTDAEEVLTVDVRAFAGRGMFRFPQFAPKSDEVLTLVMKTKENHYTLPVRLR